MATHKDVADKLFVFLRDMIYNPSGASLSHADFPAEYINVCKGLQYLHQIISESRELANHIAEGNLDCELPPKENALAAPLKNLHSSLKHLTWQAQMVAEGKYNQQVNFMGEFSVAFNDMIAQLSRREQNNFDEKARLKIHLAKMSHELRTPLNAIIGMSELAAREEMSPVARDYGVAINQAGVHLLGIINNILDFSKIEGGRLELCEDDYFLSDLISSVVNIIKIRAEESRLELKTHIAENLPDALFGDASRLTQILLNILGNAVKYTNTGFVSFSVSGEVAGDELRLAFAVEDSGAGIKEEDLSRLFDEFVRLDSHSNKSVEGTGLGLAITKGLVTAMGGEIIVTSEYGWGSVFTVILTQKITDKIKPVHEESPTAAPAPFTAPDAKVLVVDDVDLNLMVVEGILEPYEMQVDVCDGGAYALEMLTEGAYDLVFLDHMMPQPDGMAVVAAVREKGGDYFANVPIVAMTANVGEGVCEEYLSAGFSDFISKPINFGSMHGILEKWIPAELHKQKID